MKRTILIVLIYLSGYVVSYNFMKSIIQTSGNTEDWTVGDRNFSLGISLFSWFSVVSEGIVYIERNFDSDEKANW